MLFFLRKLAEALSLPVGLCILLVMAGTLSRRRWLAWCGVAILWIAATPETGLWLIAPLEAVYPQRSVSESPNADAVVVLAGGIIRGYSRAGLQWGPSSNRFFTGIDLMHAGKAKFLILTDGSGQPDKVLTHGDMLREEAIRRGIPRENIILTGPVLTTEDEAHKIAALPGIRRVILVTSAFHLPRAVLLFNASGFEVLPFPTDQHALGHRSSGLELIPQGSGILQADTALREYYGLAVYKTLLMLRPPVRR